MFAITFTACIDDAPEKEKTAEEIKAEKEKAAEKIKAENLAEFKKIIGKGVSSEEFEMVMVLKPLAEVDEVNFDKLDFIIEDYKNSIGR